MSSVFSGYRNTKVCGCFAAQDLTQFLVQFFRSNWVQKDVPFVSVDCSSCFVDKNLPHVESSSVMIASVSMVKGLYSYLE